MRSYQPRDVRWLGPGEAVGFAVKMYSINADAGPIDRARFLGVPRLLVGALPMPAQTDARVGVAILILHQGRGVDYAVLAWWDRENELPLRVFVSESGADQWRAAEGSESICVWDMEVLWEERRLYLECHLSGASSNATRYRTEPGVRSAIPEVQ